MLLVTLFTTRMFERSPAVKAAFEKFRELDNDSTVAAASTTASTTLPRQRSGRGLAGSSVLMTHGMVVMNAMDEIISCLDETSEVVELILEQGRSHARFGDNLTEDVFWVSHNIIILAIR